jgi:hypothetical protein
MKARQLILRNEFIVPEGFELITDHNSLLQKEDIVFRKHETKYVLFMNIKGLAGKHINSHFRSKDKIIRRKTN